MLLRANAAVGAGQGYALFLVGGDTRIAIWPHRSPSPFDFVRGASRIAKAKLPGVLYGVYRYDSDW